ncbi:P-loop domain-containing protein [Methanogenium organophilum]|uniref:ATPase of the ABC class C-terminal domain-containing protein n=1 Tax=Methanogenium organophilum TaxID=2199 RepID=A0A9X9S4T3_METOG|nr:P-loop domain-containing protein [Methanogenium organophilum]WAI02024.1 hypothetical protein OU421_03905 [Methanogenium organophilum]
MTETWNAALKAIIPTLTGCRAGPDMKHITYGANAYCVRSHSRDELRFCLPLLVTESVSKTACPDSRGQDGAVWAALEHIKTQVPRIPALAPVGGRGTRHPRHCIAHTEPCTLICTPDGMGEALWKPDRNNFLDAFGLHILVRGALPYPGPPTVPAQHDVREKLRDLCDAIGDAEASVSPRQVETAVLTAIDQKSLRQRLPEEGIITFIADGSLMARKETEVRNHYRIAGPKEGVHIPFFCPETLTPAEFDCEGSGGSLTGFAIRRREAVAIIGSNAEGKTTIIHGILSGVDDHAPGDGREGIVTRRGIERIAAGAYGLKGADVSLFFKSLPPGVNGTPKMAYGAGSGSLVMAYECVRACARKAPAILFDEDTAANNLLIPSSFQTEDVTPLSEVLHHNREALGETALIFAAGSSDMLVARADVIIRLKDHAADAVPPQEFRAHLQDHLREMLASLNEEKGTPRI